MLIQYLPFTTFNLFCENVISYSVWHFLVGRNFIKNSTVTVYLTDTTGNSKQVVTKICNHAEIQNSILVINFNSFLNVLCIYFDNLNHSRSQYLFIYTGYNCDKLRFTVNNYTMTRAGVNVCLITSCFLQKYLVFHRTPKLISLIC